MKVLLDKNKRFYKANLHSHSTQSDGKWSIEKIKEEYKKQGYSIVAFTDHEHLINNSELNDKDFLALVGTELAIKEFPSVSTMAKFDMKVAHLNAYAIDQKEEISPCYQREYDRHTTPEILAITKYDGEYKREYSAKGINDIIKICHEKGFLVSYNHPSWSLEDASDYLNYNGVDFVEIYNGSCSQDAHCDDEHVFADMLRHGKRVFCSCADDNHNKGGYNDSFKGWVNINADSLNYGTIINALKSGDFYASTGPEIYSLTFEDNKVKIETSPVKEIGLATKGRRAPTIHANDGEFVTSAEFDIREDDGFFRLRIEDDKGKRAYTQAYPVKEI